MINSVGSGIGSAAVQLAQLAGATVIGNASSDEKLARAAELGHGLRDQPRDAGRRRRGDAADGRPRRRPRLRARRRRALPEGPRLARARTGGSSSAAATPARSSRSTSSRSSATQKQIIGSFTYTAAEVETCLELARAREDHAARPQGVPARARRGEAMAMMERREHFGKIVLMPEGRDEAAGRRRRRHVHRPDLRRRRGGPDPRPQAPDDPRRPVAGNRAGDPRADRARRLGAVASSTRSSTGRRSRRTSSSSTTAPRSG